MKNTLERFSGYVKENKYLVFLIIFYSIFHILCHPTYWDDESYKNLITSVNYNLVTYVRVMYSLQTSRVAIEIVSAVISMLPHIVWRILDVCMIVLLYKDLEWFLTHVFQYKIDKEDAFVLTLLVCAYPFSTMACAGWKITTLNYLWVAVTALYAVNQILKVIILQQQLSKSEYVLLLLALIYSAAFESLAPLMLVGIIISAWYLKYKRQVKIPHILWGVLFVVVFSLVLIILCPGNVNRMEGDVNHWMPEFYSLNMLDKIRMGIVTAFMHFVSIPSPIFFILNTCLVMGAWVKKGNTLKKIIAGIPLAIDIFWTGYFLINYFVGNKIMTYQVPSPLLQGGIDEFEQIGLLVSVVFWFVVVLYSIYWMVAVKRSFYLSLVILLIGCVPEIIVGLSPTVVNSMLRTTIYLYIAMIFLIMCLWKELLLLGEKYNGVEVIIFFSLICGVFLNGVQMLRHIMIYG